MCIVIGDNTICAINLSKAMANLVDVVVKWISNRPRWSVLILALVTCPCIVQLCSCYILFVLDCMFFDLLNCCDTLSTMPIYSIHTDYSDMAVDIFSVVVL